MARQKAGTIAEIHAGTGREGAAPRPATTTALGKTTGKSLKGHPLGRSLDKEIAKLRKTQLRGHPPPDAIKRSSTARAGGGRDAPWPKDGGPDWAHDGVRFAALQTLEVTAPSGSEAARRTCRSRRRSATTRSARTT